MNIKKVASRLVMIFILVLGYFNYFGTEKKIEVDKNEVIETKDATYSTDGYKVEVEVQKDFIKKDETFFEKAKAFIGETIITGDNGFVDASRNLILKSNILGKAVNGWEIKTEELKFEKESEMVLSDAGLTAKNIESGITISGDKFRSDKNLNDLTLTENVKMELKNIFLTADEARYNEKNKIVDIIGNIKLSEKGTNDLSGSFKDLKYDSIRKEIISSDDFEIDYDGAKLKAKSLVLNPETEEFKISKDAEIYFDDLRVSVEDIVSTSKDIIKFNGPLNGKATDYSIEGLEAYYNRIEKKLYIVDGEIKTNDGLEIEAEEIIYDSQTKDISFIGKNKNILIGSKEAIFNTKQLDYKTETGDIFISSGKLINSEYIINSNNMKYDKKLEILNIIGKYSLEMKKANAIFIGENAQYFMGKGIFESKEEVEYKEENMVLTGKNLVYDTQNKEGIIEKNLIIISDTLNMNAEKAIYKGDENKIYIPGEIQIVDENKNLTGKTYDGVYDTKLEILSGENFQGKNLDNEIKSGEIKYYPNKSLLKLYKNVEFKNLDYTLLGEAGEVNLNTEDFKIIKVNLVSENKDKFTGDIATGNLKGNKLEIKGNSKGEVYQEDGMMKFKSSRVKVNLEKNKENKLDVKTMELFENVEIEKNEMKLLSNYLKIDNKTQDVSAKQNLKGIIKDKSGVVTTIKGNDLKGNIKTQNFVITESVEIQRDSNNELIKANSEKAEINTKENLIKLAGNVIITNSEAIIEADEVDYNISTEKIKARGNVFVEYKK